MALHKAEDVTPLQTRSPGAGSQLLWTPSNALLPITAQALPLPLPQVTAKYLALGQLSMTTPLEEGRAPVSLT